MVTRIVLLILAIIWIGCREQKKERNGRLQIVTTTGMIADAVENIVQDSADVRALMGSGVDPHLYKATQGDVSLLTEADMIFYNGLHLEGKMQAIFEKVERIKPVTAVSAGLDRKNLLKIPGTEETYDPHIWFDVQLWQQGVKEISRTLQREDSAHAEFYRKNTQRYLQQLDSVDQFVRKRIREIPPQQRVLITAHDAFGYFGKAYGVEVRGLQGISTLSEFGLQDVSQLVNFIADRQIKAVFVETSVPRRAIEAVVAGSQARGHAVRIGGNLYSDAMGAANSPEGTYAGMVRANVNTIVNSLK